MITECGNYAYDTSKWREYAISARGHNVARIDGKDQNRFKRIGERGIRISDSPMPNLWQTNRKYDIGEGYYSEGFGEDLDSCVSHHRILKFVKNKFWLLTDEFIPLDAQEHTYDIWFHLNTDKYK